MQTKIIFGLAALVASFVVAPGRSASEQHLGGRWFLDEKDSATYLFEDGIELVDLFSYHTADTNEDGIPNLRLGHDQGGLVIRSQGYPNHTTAVFPNDKNPNKVRVQHFTFRLPLRPQPGEKITQLPMGPIGVALNGVVFFNPFERGGMNAVEGYSQEWLDSCCGHPEMRGIYHYHKFPSCLKSPFPDDGKRHSPVIGFAFDGYPIYGPYESAGTMARDLTGQAKLDVCNGHTDPQRGYHYHVTPGQFPYIIGGYRGQVEVSNNRQLARAGSGPIKNNARGTSNRIGRVITRLAPAVARPGETLKVQMTLNPQRATRAPVPPETPSWFQVGPYKGQNLVRQGNKVLAQITIPADATVDVPLDCHIEFKTPRGHTVVYKKDGAFTIE
jgi:hypothetical protein